MSTHRSRLRSRAGATVFLGLAIVILVSILTAVFPATIQRLDLMAFDAILRQKGIVAPTGAVVIACIDDRSIASIGRWSWPRAYHARLVDALKDYGVAVIGFDLIFSEPEPADAQRDRIVSALRTLGLDHTAIESTLGPDNDASFARSVESQGATYAAYLFESPAFATKTEKLPSAAKRTVPLDPPPISYSIVSRPLSRAPSLVTASAYLPPVNQINRAVRGTGYINIQEDIDGKARAFFTIVKFNGQYYAPLFLVLADAYLKNAPLRLGLDEFGVNFVGVGTRTIPVDESGAMIIRFRGPAGTIPRYSVADILQRRVPRAALKDKVVLVGVTATALGDRFATLVGGDFPGVEVQANAVDNVLKGDFVRHSYEAEAEERFAGWILGIAITVIAAYTGAIFSLVTMAVLAIGCVTYSIGRVDSDGSLVGIAFPLVTLSTAYLSTVSYRYVTEGLDKRRLRRAFARYLAPTLVDRLAESSSELKLGGEAREITVMFADLSGFTVASTRMSPEDLTNKVNRYFRDIVKPIDETGGYVERFVGDAVMGMWGAPLTDEQHAINAIRAALRIIAAVRSARRQDEAKGELGFTIKIGINSGHAVVGNIGSEYRYSYTAMGEDINLASRLEGVPPLYGCLIVIGEHTAKLAQSKYLLRELDWVLLKGAAKPMAVYEPVAELGLASEDQKTFVSTFMRALDHYREKRFTEAAIIWDELVTRYEPSPSPSSVMAARARELIESPPDQSWNGVHVLTSK